MKRIILLFLLVIPLCYSLQINEFMPNPEGPDTQNEWVELYNNDSYPISLSSFYFKDSKGSKLKLNGIINPNSFSVIYRNGSSFSLNQDFDEIFLFNNSNLIDYVNYTKSKENFSWSLLNSGWYLQLPSPGKPNFNLDFCDWEIDLILNKSISEKNNFSLKIISKAIFSRKTNITLYRNITDIYNNPIKIYKPLNFTSIKRKTIHLSPNLKPNSYIMNILILPHCNDSNLKDNLISKVFVIKEPRNYDSILNIEKIYDLGKLNKTEFGKTIRIRFSVYKANTTKNVLSLWIESNKTKFSKVLSVNAPNQFQNYTFTLPIQIFPECKQKYKNQKFFIILKGLGKQIKKEINMDTSKCTLNNYRNLNLSERVINKAFYVFESKEVKTKNSAIYFFCGVLILIILTLLKENGKNTS